MIENYSDNLCQAIDLIVKKRLESVSQNQIITGTIQSKKSLNEYFVKTQFNEIVSAISENENYVANDEVYILVIGNNLNFIVAKSLMNKQVAMSLEPLDQLVIYGRIQQSDVNKLNLQSIELKCKKMLLQIKNTAYQDSMVQTCPNITIFINNLTYMFTSDDIVTDMNQNQFKLFDLPLQGIDEIQLFNVVVSDPDTQWSWELIFGDPVEEYTGSGEDEVLILKTLHKKDYDKEEAVSLWLTFLTFDTQNLRYIKQSKPAEGQEFYLQNLLSSTALINRAAAWTNYWSAPINDWEMKVELSVTAAQHSFQVQHNNFLSSVIEFNNLSYHDGSHYDASVSDPNDFYLYPQLLLNGQRVPNALVASDLEDKGLNYELRIFMYDTYTNQSVAKLDMKDLLEITWIYKLSINDNEQLETYSQLSEDNFNYEHNLNLTNLTIEGPTRGKAIFGIIKIRALYKGYEYIDYFPIAWAKSENNYLISGATKIKYSNQGVLPIYDQDKYSLYEMPKVTWDTKIFYDSTLSKSQAEIIFPTIQENSIKPTMSYYDVSHGLMTVCASSRSGNNTQGLASFCWIQPVAIYKEQMSTKRLSEQKMLDIVACLPTTIFFDEKDNPFSASIIMGKHLSLGTGIFLQANDQIIGGLTNFGPSPGRSLSFVCPETRVFIDDQNNQVQVDDINVLFSVDFNQKAVYYKNKPLEDTK